MSDRADLDRSRFQRVQGEWLEACRRRFTERFGSISFEATEWRFGALPSILMKDWFLGPVMADFNGRDASFGNALRCLLAEAALGEKLKLPDGFIAAFRLLRSSEIPTLYDVTYGDLRKLEADIAEKARNNPASARHALRELQQLGRHLDQLSAKGIIPHIRYMVPTALRAELQRLRGTHEGHLKTGNGALLDHQIEALCVAMTQLFSNDPRLVSPADRMTIALLGLEMCAPSRVNEVMCLSIDDYMKIDDYAKRSDVLDKDRMHAVHQQLIITMKGSKGASWGAKPALNFMIDVFNRCLSVIVAHGQRSRMLAAWYEVHPDKLYLPVELEYLRGRYLTRLDIARIVFMREGVTEQDCSGSGTVSNICDALVDQRGTTENPALNDLGRKTMDLHSYPWADVHGWLLKRVWEAMEDCRRVTAGNFYQGKLSKMLFLIDRKESPWLPMSLKYPVVKTRLRRSDVGKDYYQKRKNSLPKPTVFEMLGITMAVHGKEQFAYIHTHDPRRWLTTQALLHREKLSDVLINKWAGRLDIKQLDAYDYRTPKQKADIAVMPDMPDECLVRELQDFSAGLSGLGELEASYGLRTDIVAVQDAGISVTSMDAIANAAESRPVAKTSEQLIILYATEFGACLHQHHQTPCRSYSCLPCDNSVCVKGHLPTNDNVRRRSDLLIRSIINQLENLVIAANRDIPDQPRAFQEHLLTLVGNGLNPAQMAAEMIEKFHEIKHLIKDVCFANKLEEAFVASHFIAMLDDADVASGALMKYHNPTRHAAPGTERALDAHGGRDLIKQERHALVQRFPEFAPTSQGLRDQSALMVLTEDEEDDDDNVLGDDVWER